MILVMPLIELSEGMGGRKIKCLPELDEYYCKISEDPMLLVKLWRKENAKCIHIVDRDSFERRNNFMNTTVVTYLAEAVDIPLEYSSEFSDIEECRVLLNAGVYRIVLGELAIIDPIGVRKLITEFSPARVAFQCRVKNELVEFPVSGRTFDIKTFITLVKNFEGDRMVFYNEEIISKNLNYNFSKIEKIGFENNIKITLYEGVQNSQSLIELKNLRTQFIDSVIIGLPLYENKFPCQQIWRTAEAEKIELFFKD